MLSMWQRVKIGKEKYRESPSHARRREAAAMSLLSPADPAFDTWRPRDSTRQFLATRKHPSVIKRKTRRNFPPSPSESYDKHHYLFTDGSIRRKQPKVRGKAAVKAAKRARQAALKSKTRQQQILAAA